MRKLLGNVFVCCLILVHATGLAIDRQTATLLDLSRFEKKFYSQNGEDGVIVKIFEAIGAKSKYYVEFGASNGLECNTRYLRQFFGWYGLLMDGKYENRFINLQKAFITAENINQLFRQHRVPHEFDLLSIDIDYNDFYVWNAISAEYRPRVVVIEYNATHLPHEDKVVKYDPNAWWDGSNYYGASILALYQLGRKKGYSLVYAEDAGVNLFFVRDDVLQRCPVTFKNVNSVEHLYKYPRYGKGPNGGHPADPHQREYVRSDEII